MFQFEIFIIKLFAINRQPTGTIVIGDVAALAHKIRYYSVHRSVLVPITLFVRAQTTEVFGCSRHNVGSEHDNDSTGVLFADFNVQIDLWILRVVFALVLFDLFIVFGLQRFAGILHEPVVLRPHRPGRTPVDFLRLGQIDADGAAEYLGFVHVVDGIQSVLGLFELDEREPSMFLGLVVQRHLYSKIALRQRISSARQRLGTYLDVDNVAERNERGPQHFVVHFLGQTAHVNRTLQIRLVRVGVVHREQVATGKRVPPRKYYVRKNRFRRDFTLFDCC